MNNNESDSCLTCKFICNCDLWCFQECPSYQRKETHYKSDNSKSYHYHIKYSEQNSFDKPSENIEENTNIVVKSESVSSNCPSNTPKDREQEIIDEELNNVSRANVGAKVKYGKNDWIVLQNSSNNALLICVTPIKREMNHGLLSVTWKSCSLRSFLNNEWLKNEFSDTERDHIILSSVEEARTILKYGERGYATKDWIYILSHSDYAQYWSLLEKVKDPFWLRSSGKYDNRFSYVKNKAIVFDGETANQCFYVYPVINISYNEGHSFLSNSEKQVLSDSRTKMHSIHNTNDYMQSNKESISFSAPPCEDKTKCTKLFDNKTKVPLNVIDNPNKTYRDVIDFLYKSSFDISFCGFIRYENFDNFIEIMRTGKIYCRNEAQKQDKIKTDSANSNIIEKSYIDHPWLGDYVRLFYRDKTPFTLANEGIKSTTKKLYGDTTAHMPIPVLLLFDPYKCSSIPGIAFSEIGMGNKSAIKTQDVEAIKQFDWVNIFSSGTLAGKPMDEKDMITQKRNAEILIPNSITTDFIEKIVFRTNADLKHAEFILGKDCRFCVDSTKFWMSSQPGVFTDSIKRFILDDFRVSKDGDAYCVNIVYKYWAKPNDFSILNSYQHIIQIDSDGEIIFSPGRTQDSIIFGSPQIITLTRNYRMRCTKTNINSIKYKVITKDNKEIVLMEWINND